MSQLEISPVESTSESASEYSSFYVWTISGAAFVYVIVAFGLSAIPSLSRLALYASVMLLAMLILSMGKLKLSLWMLVLTLFYLYLALPALALSNVPIYRLSTLTTVFLGTLSIGIALQNRMLSYKALTYGAIAAAIINVVAIFAGVETSSHDVEAIGRYSGLMGNANALAISMALAAFLIWLYPERFSRQVRALGIFLVLYGMYITGSIKGVLMAMALFALVFMNHLVKLSMVRILAYLSAAAAGVLALYGGLTAIAAKYSTQIVAIDRILTAFAGENASINARLSMIDFGLKLWEKAPVFGYGLNQFATLSKTGSYAHNNYIELAVSGGIIALIFFYALYAIIACNALKQSKDFCIRLLLLVATLFMIDTAAVSFLDKGIMCMVGVLLAVSSEEKAEESDRYQT